MDVAKGEATEKELDQLITRRHEKRKTTEGERAVEEMWAESERRHTARKTAANRAAWYGWHMDQAERHRRNLAALVAWHEGEAEKLMQTDERRTA